MIGCLPTQALAFLAIFVYAAIAFEWKPVFRLSEMTRSAAIKNVQRQQNGQHY